MCFFYYTSMGRVLCREEFNLFISLSCQVISIHLTPIRQTSFFCLISDSWQKRSFIQNRRWRKTLQKMTISWVIVSWQPKLISLFSIFDYQCPLIVICLIRQMSFFHFWVMKTGSLLKAEKEQDYSHNSSKTKVLCYLFHVGWHSILKVTVLNSPSLCRCICILIVCQAIKLSVFVWSQFEANLLLFSLGIWKHKQANNFFLHSSSNQ